MATLFLRRRERSGLDFPRLCVAMGLPQPVPEYHFHPTRRWRFDFAFVEKRLALEQEGGVFQERAGRGRGRHTQPSGFRRDLEKYNEAAACGWRVVRVLPEDLEAPTTFSLLERALCL